MVTVTPNSVSIRFTPNEMRIVREATGKGMDELLGGGALTEDNSQAIIYSKLRREGFDVTWEQAGDIVLEFREADPTSGGPSTSSPPSAGSGE